MANSLLHSTADVIRKLLIDLSLGTQPSANADWPVYCASEPSFPDNCITVYDTEGMSDGRSMVDGEVWGHNGFQIRIRAVSHTVGWLKADSIWVALSLVQRVTVTPAVDTSYLIPCIAGIGDVLVLGKDMNSSRRLFTINATTPLRMTDQP